MIGIYEGLGHLNLLGNDNGGYAAELSGLLERVRSFVH